MKPYLFFTAYADTIDPVIQQRGWDCFWRQNVRKLKLVPAGHWTAMVRAGDAYPVEIRLLGREIISMRCGCSTGKRNFCKHVAAMLYEIEAKFPEEIEPDAVVRIPVLLKEIFGLPEGFLPQHPPRNIEQASETIKQFLSEATALSGYGHPARALAICQGLIHEIVEYVSVHPDHGGYFDHRCNDICDLMKGIILQGLPKEYHALLFDFFLAEYQKLEHIAFALYPTSFFRLPAVVEMNPAMEAGYFSFFSVQQGRFDRQELSSSPFLILLRGMAQYLIHHNRADEGIDLLVKYQNDSSVLDLLIEAETDRRNFDKARQLALDDLRHKEKKIRYSPRRYQDLLRIAMESENLNDVRFYAERCFWQTWNDIKYYRILKNSYQTSEEKQQISIYILGKLGIFKKFLTHGTIKCILEILEEERWFDRMPGFLERYPHETDLIMQYSDRLFEVDSERFFSLVTESVSWKASIKRIRSGQEIIPVLHSLEKYEGGKSIAINIAASLAAQHPDKQVLVVQLKEEFPG